MGTHRAPFGAVGSQGWRGVGIGSRRGFWGGLCGAPLGVRALSWAPHSCPDGKIAPSCLTCDSYCLNGGTCSISDKTQLPECL